MTSKDQSNNDEITSYRKKIEKYYNERKGEIVEFDNSSTEHATVVTEYLFKYAIESKQDIKIFTGKLSASFYNQFQEQARTLLKTQRISIVCEKTCEQGEFQDLIEGNERGSILNMNVAKNIGVSHFILAGGSAYRDEKSDALKTAKASFNGKMRGSFLSVLFDYIKNNVNKIA